MEIPISIGPFRKTASFAKYNVSFADLKTELCKMAIEDMKLRQFIGKNVVAFHYYNDKIKKFTNMEVTDVLTTPTTIKVILTPVSEVQAKMPAYIPKPESKPFAENNSSKQWGESFGSNKELEPSFRRENVEAVGRGRGNSDIGFRRSDIDIGGIGRGEGFGRGRGRDFDVSGRGRGGYDRGARGLGSYETGGRGRSVDDSGGGGRGGYDFGGRGPGGYDTGGRGSGGYDIGGRGRGGRDTERMGRDGYDTGGMRPGGYDTGRKGPGDYDAGGRGRGGYDAGGRGRTSYDTKGLENFQSKMSYGQGRGRGAGLNPVYGEGNSGQLPGRANFYRRDPEQGHSTPGHGKQGDSYGQSRRGYDDKQPSSPYYDRRPPAGSQDGGGYDNQSTKGEPTLYNRRPQSLPSFTSNNNPKVGVVMPSKKKRKKNDGSESEVLERQNYTWSEVMEWEDEQFKYYEKESPEIRDIYAAGFCLVDKQPVQALNEYCQKKGWRQPVFELIYDGTKEPTKVFQVQVTIESDVFIADRVSLNKKQAKVYAALKALYHLGVTYVTNQEGDD